MVFLVLSAAFFSWLLLRSREQAPTAGQNTAGKNLSPAAFPLEGKTSDEGGVKVSIQPLDIQSSEWTFGVVMDTHTGDLDANLAKSATLVGGSEKIFTPIRWEGAPPGGHHRQGTLVFQAITPRPGSITLTIKDVGGVSQRKFEWQLKD